MMLDQLVRHWWVLAVRGALAILFGVIAFVLPGHALLALVLLWGAWAFIDGVFAMVAALRAAERHARWGALLLEGVVGIAAGIFTFAWPGMTAIALLYLVAAWAIVTGILEIVAAVRLRRLIEGEWLLGLSGAASVLLGVLLMLMPAAGLVAWVWVIGAYALLFG